MNVPAPNDPELDALARRVRARRARSGRTDPGRCLSGRERRGARDEVDELRESAASLALAPVDDTTAPPELWERISRDDRG